MAQPAINAVVIGFKNRAEVDEAIERINRAAWRQARRTDVAVARDSVERRTPGSVRSPHPCAPQLPSRWKWDAGCRHVLGPRCRHNNGPLCGHIVHLRRNHTAFVFRYAVRQAGRRDPLTEFSADYPRQFLGRVHRTLEARTLYPKPPGLQPVTRLRRSSSDDCRHSRAAIA